MRLTEDVCLVGSWQKGLSNDYDCEVYALEAGEEVVLIDAGCGRETERILANLKRDRVDPARVGTVLLTHEHSDHAAGAAVFRERFGARVMCHAAARPLVERGTDHELGLDVARPNGVLPQDFQYRHSPVDRALEDGETVEVGALKVRVIFTPGHSPGSACYLVDTAAGRALFSGDVVFWGGLISLLNYWGCDLNAYRESLKKLAGLKVDLLLPGHHQFTLRDGQRHLDRAIDLSQRLYLPPSPPRFR